jgi:tRNA(Leu) C34 or U34 (ribose-2'-O)-methylase TrmL
VSEITEVTGARWGKGAPPRGVAPAVALVDPKYPHNVGLVVRLASCYGLKQVWFSGDRVTLDPGRGERLPREERMKGYKDVELVQYDHFFDQFPGGGRGGNRGFPPAHDTTPVAVEVRANSEPLHGFEHPEHALYVFGPEDGSIPPALLPRCHRFVVIPTRHCLNLATAVATVLWDREYKRWLKGEIDAPTTPGAFEHRGTYSTPEDIVFGTG